MLAVIVVMATEGGRTSWPLPGKRVRRKMKLIRTTIDQSKKKYFE
jgi:hypothetical protein